MPAPGEDLKTTEGWDTFVRRHQGNASGGSLAPGQERLSNGTVIDSKTKRPIPPEKVQWRYELGDGSTIHIDQEGTITHIDEKAPSVATGTKDVVPTGTWSQTEYRDDPDHPGGEVKWGIDPADRQWRKIPGTERPKEEKHVSDASKLQRLDARGQKIEPGDTTTPVAKLYDPIKGTVSDMPDPKTLPKEGTAHEFGDKMLWIKPDGTFTVMDIQKSGAGNIKIYQGPNGEQIEYDPSKPAGQRTTTLTPGKPDVVKPTDYTWKPIPGTNDEQAYRTVVKDGQTVTEEVTGVTKPRATTLMGDANSRVWTVLDAQQNPIKTIDNPGWREKYTTQDVPTDRPYIYQSDSQGNLSTADSQNYQPTTAAQIAGQSAKLQQMMSAKAAELKAKVDAKTITPDEYAAQFNSWFDQTIEPQKQYLLQAQQDVELKRAKEAEDLRRQALQQAQQAGRDVVSGVQAQYPYMVGPKAGEVAAAAMKGQLPSGADLAQSAFFQLPDTNKLYEQATMRALKAISPTAAQATGGPVPDPNAVNINDQLSRTNYAYQGAPAPAGPMEQPPVPPPGPVTDTSGLLAPGLAGTNQDPNVMASGGVPPGYPNIYPPYGPRRTWTQSMPNFGNPQLPNYVYGG